MTAPNAALSAGEREALELLRAAAASEQFQNLHGVYVVPRDALAVVAIVDRLTSQPAQPDARSTLGPWSPERFSEEPQPDAGEVEELARLRKWYGEAIRTAFEMRDALDTIARLTREVGEARRGPVAQTYADLIPRSRVIEEVIAERERQDAEWGGPEHDDEHVVHDWRKYRGKQERKVTRLYEAIPFDASAFGRDGTAALVKIAALAIAQAESIHRALAPVPGGGE